MNEPYQVEECDGPLNMKTKNFNLWYCFSCAEYHDFPKFYHVVPGFPYGARSCKREHSQDFADKWNKRHFEILELSNGKIHI